MKFLNQAFAFYVNSSIHVALAVVALLAVSVMEYDLIIPNELWAFVFLGALTGYNFVKYAKVAGLHHRSLTQSLKTIQVLSGVCFLALAIIAFQLSITTLLVTTAFGLATFFYAVPFIRHKNLRNFSGLKIFVVAFVWAGVTVIVPFVASENDISGDVLLTFLQRILIVVALILPFEIRDVPYDSLNLKTLPQQVGVRQTKLLGEVLLTLCLVFEFFKENSGVAYIVSMLIFCVVLGWMIVISKTNQTRYFSSFWVEALPILWFLVFVLFN
ncbi:hypothetical protein Aeqsu_1739 [Aequorivita sublithincola DSM 14238]|uniref:Prenyltransferase n=1 Tax=Aequorivita sublithincola (strain DSM 14238 / LMG 21431 / ACAM 643 / 9-3) TaxID=746697 RepID=I3YW51_AEQSU|nr:hypothetical protein [Aequorivita sublithincola]AFL81219.1 hypothetical protein Aeqsu_1739 [Aequorivita sublithincola DSM 14238]